jgi:hypothetical protein
LDEPAQAAAVPEAVEPSEYLRGYMEGKREAAPPAGISPAPLAGSEWISIDERLPEHEAEVLVTGFEGNDPSKPRWTQIAHFHKEGSFYDHDTGEAFYPPTHWMPLPAAPRAALSQGDVSGEGEGS